MGQVNRDRGGSKVHAKFALFGITYFPPLDIFLIISKIKFFIICEGAVLFPVHILLHLPTSWEKVSRQK